MDFNIDAIIAQLKQRFEALALQKVPVITATITLYLNNAETRLASIAETYATDQNEEYIKMALADEAKIFESEYLSLYVIGKEIAAESQNELITQITTIVMQVLSQLIIKA